MRNIKLFEEFVNESDLLTVINAEIKKHEADPEYDEGGENMNKVYDRFEKEHFTIDADKEASDYILKATPVETLEYLKKRIEQNPHISAELSAYYIVNPKGGISRRTLR